MRTIVTQSDLPTITGPLTIDGDTQPGSRSNRNGLGLGDNRALLIQIALPQRRDGSNGLVITGGASTVRGLILNGFTNGINIQANGGNTVAGNSPQPPDRPRVPRLTSPSPLEPRPTRWPRGAT